MKKAIVLCSGGLDSVVTANYVKSKGFNGIIILFFNYGQRSLARERTCSRACAKKLGAEFIEIKLGWLGKISTSAINKENSIKEFSVKNLKNTKKESEKYYVPCRNTVFLVHALALAESLAIREKNKYEIFVGFKNEGKESYPDTTPEFVYQMNKLSKIASKGIKIRAPLIKKDKEDIICLGKSLGVDFKKTFSCYLSNKDHCGKCLACALRKYGFYWANIEDPTKYIGQSQ